MSKPAGSLMNGAARRSITALLRLLGAMSAGAAAGSAGCGSEDAECSTDVQCAMGHTCLSGGCVARLGAEGAVWSVDVSPQAPSPHAVRELVDFKFTTAPALLQLDRKVVVNATLSRPPGQEAAAASSVNVTAAVPSTIPGRRNLWFEAQSANRGPGTPYELALQVPERLLGRSARLTVTPAAPLNRTMCPWWLEIPLLAGSAVPLPGAEDTISLTGTMEPAGAPPVEFEARIFVNDQLGSNLGRTDATGRFQVEVQKSWATREGVTSRVEIGPADPALPVPTLTMALPLAGGSLGSLRMPMHPPPVQVVVPVMDASGARGVAGATVRFSAVVEGAVGGEARYTRTAQTGTDGKATLLLVPSALGQGLTYAVRVVPPADSESGSRCLAGYAVATPEADGSRTGAAILLPARVVLDGHVIRADGRSAPGMRVRATRTGDLFNQDCGGPLASPPAETTTNDSGRYRLRLDPGEYRLEYEPPPGSALPRAVEDRVPIMAPLGRQIPLPPAVVVEGQVVAADGQAVAGAEVRAFGPPPAPDVRAEIRGVSTSDGAGRFRMVVPHPAAGAAR